MAGCFCLMCQFEYRRKKYLSLKIPNAHDSTPSLNTCYEEIPPSPSRYQLHRLRVKRALKAAANKIKEHKKKSLQRSLSVSENLASSTLPEWWSFIPRRRITGGKVKRALKAKSRRYKRGHFRPCNRPGTPATTPRLAPHRFSCSLSDIIGLLSLEDNGLCKSDTISVDTLKPPLEQGGSVDSLVRVVKYPSKRCRYVSADSSTSSIVSLATLKNSLSEYSQHSGDPELEYDLYDCDLNNVSAAPGSLFNPTVFFDLTPTDEEPEDELELTELFPMLRK